MRPLRKSAASSRRSATSTARRRSRASCSATSSCSASSRSWRWCSAAQMLVDLAPPEYADAAGLIPFTAAAAVMPSVYRTVNQNMNLAHKRALFIAGCVGAAMPVHGHDLLLAPEIGAYAAPIGMLVGFGIPSALMFARNQLRAQADRVPLWRGADALVLAVVIAVGVRAAPSSAVGRARDRGRACSWLFLAALVPLGVIPAEHRARCCTRCARSVAGRRRLPAAPGPARARARRARASCGIAAIARLPPERLSREGLRRGRAPRRPTAPGGLAPAGSRSPNRIALDDPDRALPVRGRLDRGSQREHAERCSRPAPTPTTCARSRTRQRTSPASPTRAGRVSGRPSDGRRWPGAERRRRCRAPARAAPRAQRER